jgi:ribosomal subunit interface protein
LPRAMVAGVFATRKDRGRSGVDIVVKGRNVEVPEHYRIHVTEKLEKIERYDGKTIAIDVELIHEPNPRQSEHCQRVELTWITKGPVIRAEAGAPDFYSALDLALNKLEGRLRKAADRRRVHRGRHAPISVAEATAGLAVFEPPIAAAAPHTANGAGGSMSFLDEDSDQPWHIVREKEFVGEPMTIEDALFQMELVGHNFYLFHDKESGRPCVVYRRHAYDYGLLTLSM